MYKKVFTIDGFDYVYIGYTSGRRWNGWATPHFEFAEVLEVMHEYNECSDEILMEYDKVYDQFYKLDKDSGELETWKGEDYNTTEGIKHLYGIGAYSWVWDDITDYDIENIASYGNLIPIIIKTNALIVCKQSIQSLPNSRISTP